MNCPLQKRSDSKSDDHEHVGSLKSEHVLEEVLSQLTIFVVVDPVDGKGTNCDQEEHEDHQHLEHFGWQVQAEGSQSVSEAEEAEELHIFLDEELKDYPPKGVGSEEDTNFEVEE